MGVLKRLRRDLLPNRVASKLITLRVPEDLLEAFDRAARVEGEDRSGAIKILMAAYLHNKIKLK